VGLAVGATQRVFTGTGVGMFLHHPPSPPFKVGVNVELVMTGAFQAVDVISGCAWIGSFHGSRTLRINVAAVNPTVTNTKTHK